MRWSDAMGGWFSFRIPVRWSGGMALPKWMRFATELFPYPLAFPGPDDFVGSFTPIPGAVQTGLQSTYSGAVVVTEVARGIVQQMLPAGHTLAPLKGAYSAARHPVLHLIGQQREPSTLFYGLVAPVAGAPGYDEMILVVPFVLRPNGALWHNYVVRMYLTDYIAVFGGNEFFGYQKVVADLPRTDTAGGFGYTVDLDNPPRTMFRTDVSLASPAVAGPAASALPRWPDVKKILEMPFLGVKPDGTEVCSHWELDFTNATVAPATSKHQVFHKFRNGMEPWETLGPLQNTRQGAFVVETVRWRLGWPQPVQGC